MVLDGLAGWLGYTGERLRSIWAFPYNLFKVVEFIDQCRASRGSIYDFEGD